MKHSPVEIASKLTERGFAVFPLQVNGKKPVINAFTEKAATTHEEVKKLWFDPVMETEQPFNIGIATTRYKNGTDHEALLVVDVDMKNDKNGIKTLNELELNGKTFPQTMEQKTPTGGLHLIYKVKQPVKQGADVLGEGLDVRSRGGFIVGVGSTVEQGQYQIVDREIAEAPQWMIDKCNEKVEKVRKQKKKSRYKTNSKASVKRVTDYLKKAQPAIEGKAGDEQTFKVASRCKDLGVDASVATELLLEHWNHKCQPPWSPQELQYKVENAYSYGQNEQGCDAPEAEFEDVEHGEEHPDCLGPVQELNENYSFVIVGGRSTVIKKEEETNDTVYMDKTTFHDLLKSKTIFVDGKWRQLSDVWMESPNRSTYTKIEMIPSGHVPSNVYNLWRGFSCDPLGEEEQPTQAMVDGVQAFIEHAENNVCEGDKFLYKWLMSYFAHMVQRPEQKPTTALVFRGEKGVGKNALIDRIGHLFAPHYLLTSSKRYLTSNFNNHLARLLLFVLDEAFWSGDKGSEGVLKDLITGNKHLIEQKGREMYEAKNLTRICIIGNEDWLVPSSQDERRFCVFNVGDNRQQDTKFFRDMRKNIDQHGGNRLLLTELLKYDISNFNPNKAPNTIGLLDQKIQSLNIVHEWWFQCLQEGGVAGMGFGGGSWPKEPLSKNMLKDSFTAYTKERGIRSWLPSPVVFGRLMKKACPGMENTRVGPRNNRQWAISVPKLTDCRAQFEDFIRQPVAWETQPDDSLVESELFS